MKTRNLAMVLGHVGHDPTFVCTPSGVPIARFHVATNERYKDKKTQEWQTRTEWHTCIAFGKLADLVKERLSKGNPVDVTGRMRTRSWIDQEHSVTRYSAEIIVDSLILLTPPNRASQLHPSDDDYSADTTVTDIPDEDIPF